MFTTIIGCKHSFDTGAITADGHVRIFSMGAVVALGLDGVNIIFYISFSSLVVKSKITLIERIYEDHEMLVDNLMIWTRDSKNRLLFVTRPERTMLFEQPELLSGPNSTTRGDNVDECSRSNMIEVSLILMV